MPFLCLALSEVGRELERFRESDAYGGRGERGTLVQLQSFLKVWTTEMHIILKSLD